MEEDKKLVQIVVHEDPTRLTSVYCSTDEEEKEEHQHEVMEQLAEVGVDLGKEDIVLHIPYPYLPKKYVSATLGADSEKLPQYDEPKSVTEENLSRDARAHIKDSAGSYVTVVTTDILDMMKKIYEKEGCDVKIFELSSKPDTILTP